MTFSLRLLAASCAAGALLLAGSPPVSGAPVAGGNVLYTVDADFDQGTRVNTNHDAPNSNQLQLNEETETFPFIWIALSARGTIAKIDTGTGTILGEYSTTSDGDGGHNTSRTTVGLDGSVWAGNRNQSSAIHVGLLEANQCVDRNENGTIETSSGYGDVLAWPGGTYGSSAPVSEATDECILHYVDTEGGDARHVSVDPDGDIWIASTGTRIFHEIDANTGAIIRTAGPFSCGGYGGLVDGNGVIWSATSSGASPGVLRYDPDAPDGPTNPRCVPIPNYGMAIDGNGYVWVSELFGGNVRKVAPDGTTWETFSQGAGTAQGLAVDFNGDVWISSSLFSGTVVSHLRNDGTFVGNVSISPSNGPTGIAVDAAGKVWSANINSSDATRIDPAAGGLGGGGTTIGAVDLRISLPGASPYNYSDMTGALLLGSTAPQGTWTVTQDGGEPGTTWGKVIWNAEPQGSVPPGTTITVEARAADTEAGLGGQAFTPLGNGTAFSLTGRFLEVRAILRPNDDGVSPVLSDIRICTVAAACVGGAAPPPTSTPPADIGVTKVDTPDPVAVGANISYTMVVTNHGPGHAPNAALSDVLPAGVTYVSSSTTLGSCAFASGTLRCSFGTMAPGDRATVTLVVRADQAGTIVNRAGVGTTVADPNVGNNQVATAVTTVQGPFTPPAAPEQPAPSGCALSTGTPSVFAGVRSTIVVRARYDDGSPRADVALTLRGAGKARTARTNAEGIARFAVVPRSAGRLTVRGAGCGAALAVAAVRSQSCVGLVVTPKGATVGRGSVLTVRVRIDGRPAVGVRVLARGAGLALSAVTNSAGVARLSGTATRPGVVSITVPDVLACSKRVGVSGAFQPPEVTG